MIYKGKTIAGRRFQQKRICRLQAAMTLTEHRQILKLAQQQSMSISAFIRAQVIGQQLPCRLTPTARKTYRTLGRLQSNLWQLNRLLGEAHVSGGSSEAGESTAATLQTAIGALEQRARRMQCDIVDLPDLSSSNHES